MMNDTATGNAQSKKAFGKLKNAYRELNRKYKHMYSILDEANIMARETRYPKDWTVALKTLDNTMSEIIKLPVTVRGRVYAHAGMQWLASPYSDDYRAYLLLEITAPGPMVRKGQSLES